MGGCWYSVYKYQEKSYRKTIIASASMDAYSGSMDQVGSKPGSKRPSEVSLDAAERQPLMGGVDGAGVQRRPQYS